MSDYDESVSLYANALEVSERQVPRYCRAGFIPSAERITGRTGRPKWVIRNTSPEAIEAVRGMIVFQRFEPRAFSEPIRIRQGPDAENGSTPTTIAWRPLKAAPIRDRYSLITML